MGHQKNRIFAALGFFQNGAIQLRDRWFELVEQFQKFFAPATGPGSQPQMLEFHATFLREQLFLSAQPLAHGQRVQLVAQHRAHAYELVAVPKELAEGAVGWRGDPDLLKSPREHEIEDDSDVP